MDETSTPVSIRLENCSSKTCERYSTNLSLVNRQGLRTVRGSIDFVDCRFEADKAGGVYIQGNEADGCRIRFERCEIIRRDKAATRLAPITIEAPRRLDLDVGNVEIADCVIRDSIARRPLGLVVSPMTRVRNVSGSLTHETPQGKTTFALDAEQLAVWFPQQGLVDNIPRIAFDWRKMVPVAVDSTDTDDDNGGSVRLRGKAALLVWGTAEKPLELIVKVEPVGRYTPPTGTMTLTGPDGDQTRLSPTVRDDRIFYTFSPQVTGPHRIEWQGDSKSILRLIECSAPLGFLGESLGADLFRWTGTLYFAVPSGVERFAIQITGAGTAETVKATLRDPSGRVVGEQDKIAAPHVFVLKREQCESTEIWSATLEKASEGVLEDVSIQTLGIPSVFAGTPRDVFSTRANQH
jgi:hypothetical protein